MLDNIKQQLKKTADLIDEISDDIEDKFEDLSEEAQATWRDRQAYIAKIKSKLNSSEEQFKEHSDTFQLQAHLALMEAHTLWQSQQKEIQHSLSRISQQGKKEAAEISLQAHLAKMDLSDAYADKKEQLTKSFKENRRELENQSQHAADEIQQFFSALKITLKKT